MFKSPRLLGLLLLLTAVFTFLKLGHVVPFAHWSWWAVLAPLWAAWSLLLVGVLVLVVVKSLRRA